MVPETNFAPRSHNHQSNCCLNFENALNVHCTSSLNLRHVTKVADLPELTLGPYQDRRSENTQEIVKCEFFGKEKSKVDSLSLKSRGSVWTLSKESRTIDISWERCLSSAGCVEGKQRLNKDTLVIAFFFQFRCHPKLTGLENGMQERFHTYQSRT